MSRRTQFIASTNPLNLAGKAIASLSKGKLTALLVAATLLAVIGAAVACGRDSGSDELVVYSGRSESLVEPIIQQFREATGMTVNVKYASTGELAATLLEEGDKSPADIFFAQDPGGLGTVEGTARRPAGRHPGTCAGLGALAGIKVGRHLRTGPRGGL